MKTTKTYRKSRFAQVGCALLCTFYAIGLFNGLVLEGLHEVSHFMGPKTHHHSFFAEQEEVDYSSLEAMAGHSHEALEALKELLQANQQDEQESQDTISFKFDKHFVERQDIVFGHILSTNTKTHWVYYNKTSVGYEGVTTPPPRHS
ncbi:hypothetical protein [Flagellimonas aequoris]|uniref:Uncharacterized protein n=1 Tax=Flagellimonas aequoris TaxID=2306997 RepID=A0ABY3KY14_9FLAO|nr:hypothetical protein [Allomuricauda aequoris]TXK07358.1 hypothetical protein FQ019_01130 [Allomuricauda aequoris]